VDYVFIVGLLCHAGSGFSLP